MDHLEHNHPPTPIHSRPHRNKLTPKKRGETHSSLSPFLFPTTIHTNHPNNNHQTTTVFSYRMVGSGGAGGRKRTPPLRGVHHLEVQLRSGSLTPPLLHAALTSSYIPWWVCVLFWGWGVFGFGTVWLRFGYGCCVLGWGLVSFCLWLLVVV